jgi:hypothetical protein
MKTLALLGTTLGFAFAAGLNLYATVLVIGAAVRFGWVTLPPALQSLAVLGHPLVLGVAAVLYLVEFVADKVPAVDHAWDAVHTFIRPAGAVWIAWRTIGGSGLPEPAEVALLLAAGGVALTTHAGKAGTRLAVGATGGHVLGAGILLSLLEDLVAFFVAPLSLLVPLLVLLVVIVGVVLAAWVLVKVRRRRHRRAAPLAD